MAIVKCYFELTNSGEPSSLEKWAISNCLQDIFPQGYWGSEGRRYFFKEEEEHIKSAQLRIRSLYESYKNSRILIHFTSELKFKLAKDYFNGNRIYYEIKYNNDIPEILANIKMEKRESVLNDLKEYINNKINIQEVTI